MRYPVRPGVPSENGWPMCNADRCVRVGMADLGVPAAVVVPLRAGDVATILVAWMLHYHRTIEPIRSQVWGWSADNDVANSNHMSGTAIDINAPWYPWGARTMPAARVARIEAELKKFRGVVFWGRWWDRADEMHYQIGVGPNDPRVAALANELNNGYLGIYGPPPEENDMTPEQDRLLKEVARQLGPWPQLGKNDKGQPLTLVDAIAGLSRQLGPWPQLGTNDKGQPLTLIDAIAGLIKDVDELKGGK